MGRVHLDRILHESDIASHALEALRQSKIRRIYIVGRGGPLNAKFTSKELREFDTLENCSVRVAPEFLGEVPEDLPHLSIDQQQNITLLRKFAQQDGDEPTHCEFRFRSPPTAFLGEDRVESVQLKTPDGPVTIAAGLVFCCIGWFTTAMDGVPYDSSSGVHANVDGRICSARQAVEDLYTVGWSKRGANGVIGTNRACGRSTADLIIEDLPRLKQRRISAPDKLEYRLLESNVQLTDYSGWQNIDRAEVEEGVVQGRPRVKIATLAELLAAAEQEGGDSKCL